MFRLLVIGGDISALQEEFSDYIFVRVTNVEEIKYLQENYSHIGTGRLLIDLTVLHNRYVVSLLKFIEEFKGEGMVLKVSEYVADVIVSRFTVVRKKVNLEMTDLTGGIYFGRIGEKIRQL